MADKTVKIEYQFIGEDAGLTTKIDDIYKKLDKLGEGASVVIKKLDGVNNKTTTLTNTVNTATGKMNVFSSEMRELQAEADKATKEVNELVNALNRLNSTKNNGSLNNQKQLNNLTQDTLNTMQKLASAQKKLENLKYSYNGSPKFKELEQQLKSANNEFKLANKLSEQLSNRNYKKLNRKTVNTGNSNKAIQDETKAIQANTKAQKENRKVVDRTFKKSPFSKTSGRITSDIKKITQAYKNGSKLNSSSEFKGTDLEVSGKTVASMYRSTNPQVKKLLAQYSAESQKRDKMAEEIGAFGLNEKATKSYVNQAVKAQKLLKDVDDILNKTNTNKTFDNGSRNYKRINQETKAIQENTQAQKENLKISNIKVQKAPFNDKATSLSTQASETLKQASIKQIDVKGMSDRISNELKAQYGATQTNAIRQQVQQQQVLNNAKQETLKLEEKIANTNNQTAKINGKNVDKQIKAEETKHQLAVKTIQAQEESKNRQYESGRKYAQDKRQDAFNFKQQTAYNKAVEKLPNEYKNLTNKYNTMTSKVKEETAKIDAVSNTLSRKALKGYISSSDIEKAQKSLLNSQSKINDNNEKIERLNQRAQKVAYVAMNEAKKVSGLNMSKQSKYYTNENGSSKTYRTTNGSSIKNTSSVLDNVKNYKVLGEGLNKAQSKLSSEMISLSASSMKLGNNLNGIQSGLGQFANAMRGIGNTTTGLGKNISNLGKSMMNTGQNVQMLANSLRVLSNLAITGFKMAGQQGIEFDKSLMGVASTLNRIQINPDGTTSVMSDVEFDGIINDISNKAREQARTSMYDANQVMEAYRYTAMAGWDANEMMSSMDTFINMATVARIEGSNFSTIVDLITDSLASLGMAYEGIDIDGDGVFDEKVRKDAEGLSESVQKLSDVMVKAQSISNLSLTELSESYKKGASQLTLYGLELEEITALYSILANRGIKGSQSATGLSSIMANLTAKTGQASKALDEITQKTGIDVKGFDSKGQYIGIDAHLGKLSKAFKKLKEMYGTEYGVDNLQLAQMLGGKHHFKSLAKILEGYDTGEYHEILTLLKNSDGSTAEMAEITNQSTWAQLKITLSEVKEAFMSLWTVIEPVFLDILEIIQEVARAFTKLSDEQKMNIAKWMAIIVVGTTLASIFSTVLIVIGSLVSMLGTFVMAIGKMISFGGILLGVFTNWSNIMGLLTTVFPQLATLGITTFKGLATFIGGVIAKLSIFAGAITISINMLGKLGRAFSQAKEEGNGFLDVIGKTISNMTKEMEHASLSFGEKIANFFNLDQDKIAKNLAKVFKMVINMFDNFINMLTFGLAEKFSNFIGDKLGTNGMKEWIVGKLDYRIENGMEGKNLFESDLDRKAKSEGYENYEDKIKGDRNKKILNTITTIFDGEETGAFSNLIKKIEDADGAKVELTTEDVKLDAIDYKSLKDSIKESKTYMEELDSKIGENIDNILKYNKQLDELKTKINNTSNENTKKNLQKQYDEIKEKRDAEIELKYSNEDEYRKKTAELTEKEDKLITITTEYKNAGKEEELEYESIKEEFEQKHGSQLSFVNADEDIKKVEHLKKNIEEIKKEFKKKLDSGMLSDEDYIKVYTALEKIDKFESGADKYDDLVRQQEIVKETAENKKLIQEEIDKQQKVIDDILKKNGLKKGQENKLEGTDKEAYDKANKLKEGHQKDYDDESNKHNLAEKAIADMGDLQDVYDLWNLIYGNDKPLMKLFDEEELAILQQLGFGKKLGSEDTPTMNLKENHKGVITDKSEAVNTVDTENSKNNKNTSKPVQGPEPNFIRFNGKNNGLNENTKDKEGNNKTTQESNANTQANTEITTANTDALNANTEAVNANNEAKSETPSQSEQVETDTSGVDEFSQKVDTASQEAQANLDNLVAKTTEMSDALGKIDLSGIAEAFTIVYVAVEEARNMLSNIAGFAVNTGVASFQAMGDSLKTAISEARTTILGICGIADNRGSSSLTNMGQALTNALDGARNKILSVCNVALNRGVSAMTTMGSALTSALSGASSIVAGIANQINTIKNTANSIKIPEKVSYASNMTPISMANNTATMSALRSITNNSINNIANTSNFSFNVDSVLSSNKRDIKTTARQLTTYCRRRGL